MKFKFPKKNLHPKDVIRKCGYGELHDKKYNTISYTRKLGGGHYPRFHIYYEEFPTYFEVALHLDQKQPSYGKETAHSGDYDGPAVENEARRMTEIVSEIYGL